MQEKTNNCSVNCSKNTDFCVESLLHNKCTVAHVLLMSRTKDFKMYYPAPQISGVESKSNFFE